MVLDSVIVTNRSREGVEFVWLSITTMSMEGLLYNFLTVTGVRCETPQETGAHERPYLSLTNTHNQCVHSVLHSHNTLLFHLHPDSEWHRKVKMVLITILLALPNVEVIDIPSCLFIELASLIRGNPSKTPAISLLCLEPDL